MNHYRNKVYNLQSLSFLRNHNLKIGILGGTFNPCHSGHLQITYQALKILKLDFIIWLVSLQNPFKKNTIPNIFLRAKNITKVINHPKILITTAEAEINSQYTYNTINVIKKLLYNNDFTFLMGADNIKSFSNWFRYKDICNLCNIVVFDRPNNLNNFNYNNFTMNFKVKNVSNSDIIVDKNKTNIYKEQRNNMIYRCITSKISSSLINKNL